MVSCLPVGREMAFEVLDEHFINAISGGRVGASVTHGATSAVQVLPHHHRDFPHTCANK